MLSIIKKEAKLLKSNLSILSNSRRQIVEAVVTANLIGHIC